MNSNGLLFVNIICILIFSTLIYIDININEILENNVLLFILFGVSILIHGLISLYLFKKYFFIFIKGKKFKQLFLLFGLTSLYILYLQIKKAFKKSI